MISLDQVYLLEEKVESAVAKIQQLQAENDALRKKCAELTNALSAKSEQLTTIETDQTQIENGIKKALDRLNSIENSVLKTVSSMNTNGQAASPITQAPSFATMSAMPQSPAPQKTETPVQEISVPTNENPVVINQTAPDSIPEINETPFSESIPENDDNEEDELGFDIF